MSTEKLLKMNPNQKGNHVNLRMKMDLKMFVTILILVSFMIIGVIMACLFFFNGRQFNLIINSNSIDENEKLSRDKFEKFTIIFAKKYSTEQEKEKRFTIFKENLVKIDSLNRNGRGTATYGVTKFADLTLQEFLEKHTGLRPDLDVKSVKSKQLKLNFKGVLPDNFDWRTESEFVVSPVKNQGDCGSCWAFSTTGNIEGQWGIVHQEAISLSEQELVDCEYDNDGCNGGYMTRAYQWIMDNGGLVSENDYPYEAVQDQCHSEVVNLTQYTIDSWETLSTDETYLAQVLVNNGPIAIGINAVDMQHYDGGVSRPSSEDCDPYTINHGVLIVGFGVESASHSRSGEGEHRHPPPTNDVPYWIIKNSWAETWGEQGYYRVYRGDGACGLNTMASTSVINR